jgi:hypothetical protein
MDAYILTMILTLSSPAVGCPPDRLCAATVQQIKKHKLYSSYQDAFTACVKFMKVNPKTNSCSIDKTEVM